MWLRRLLRLPEVGFWPGVSTGISLRVIEAVARIGVPSGRNIVYLAETDSRYPRKSARTLLLPHSKVRIGGLCWRLLADDEVGLVHSKRVLTSSETSPKRSS